MNEEKRDTVDSVATAESTEEFSGTKLQVSDDKLAVVLDCPDPGGQIDALLDDVQNQLGELGLTELPDRPQLAAKIQEARGEGDILGLVLIEGTAPVAPEDGRIEWEQDFFATGFNVESASGRVDYWQRMEKLSVTNGQVLARVHPPKPGSPGTDVFGNDAAVDEPQEAVISQCPNVEYAVDADIGVYTATIDGRIRWADGVLAVDDVFTIDGDVGLETGNISHPGAVEVNGNVLTGATIEAEGDIVVKGLVEPANIRSNGSLTVRGGIVGREDCKIDLGGGVHAKYILDASIAACGTSK
jgi:uncharacterized protein (DUF342 family)